MGHSLYSVRRGHTPTHASLPCPALTNPPPPPRRHTAANTLHVAAGESVIVAGLQPLVYSTVTVAAGGSLTIDSDVTDVLQVGALTVRGTLTIGDSISTVVVTSGSFNVTGDGGVVSVANAKLFVAPRSDGVPEVFVGAGARLGADGRGDPVESSRHWGGSHAGAGGDKFFRHYVWSSSGAANAGFGCALLPSTPGEGALYGAGGGVLHVFAGCLPGAACASSSNSGTSGTVEVHGALSADGGRTAAGGSLLVRAARLIGAGVVSGEHLHLHCTSFQTPH